MEVRSPHTCCACTTTMNEERALHEAARNAQGTIGIGTHYRKPCKHMRNLARLNAPQMHLAQAQSNTIQGHSAAQWMMLLASNERERIVVTFCMRGRRIGPDPASNNTSHADQGWIVQMACASMSMRSFAAHIRPRSDRVKLEPRLRRRKPLQGCEITRF